MEFIIGELRLVGFSSENGEAVYVFGGKYLVIERNSAREALEKYQNVVNSTYLPDIIGVIIDGKLIRLSDYMSEEEFSHCTFENFNEDS